MSEAASLEDALPLRRRPSAANVGAASTLTHGDARIFGADRRKNESIPIAAI